MSVAFEIGLSDYMLFILILWCCSFYATEHIRAARCKNIRRSNIWSDFSQQCLKTNSKVVNMDKSMDQTKPNMVNDTAAVSVTQLFIQQGYDPTHIPQNLEGFDPTILHDSLLVFRSDSQLEIHTIYNHAYVALHLAKYNKTKSVVVQVWKSFELETVVDTAMISAYLQDDVPTPKCFGLTQFEDKLAIVLEYIPKAQALSLFLTARNVTVDNWLSLAMQITKIVVQIHSKFVLLNDMQPNTFFVNWNNGHPLVHVTELSQATFNTTSTFQLKDSDIQSPIYTAPELRYGAATNLASDIFGLGHILRLINWRLQNQILARVILMCMQENPDNRPSAKDVNFMLSVFLMNLDSTKAVLAAPKKKHLPYLFDRVSMMNAIPFISHTSLVNVLGKGDKVVWIRKNKYNQVYVAELHGNLVVVKRTMLTAYEFIRQEALVHQLMNHTGVVPYFYGLYATGQNINSLSLVSEFYGKSITMDAVVDDVEKQSFDFQVSLVTKMCDIVQTFHDNGLLINNIALDNFLVGPNKTEADLRIIGLHSTSGLGGKLPEYILDELAAQNDTAVFVYDLRRTSVASDVYSLGRALSKLQMHSVLKLGVVLLFKDCFLEGILKCPSLDLIKHTLQSINQLKDDE